MCPKTRGVAKEGFVVKDGSRCVGQAHSRHQRDKADEAAPEGAVAALDFLESHRITSSLMANLVLTSCLVSLESSEPAKNCTNARAKTAGTMESLEQLFTGLTRWRGLGRRASPVSSLFLAECRGSAAALSEKTRFLEGLQPSKPPRNGRPHNSCYLVQLFYT